jgi:creatinine amidohydrolase
MAAPTRGHRLSDATWPQVETAGTTASLVVPIGSVEQHGPHLPLGTDTVVAEAISSRAAAVLGDVLLAPAIAYGSSGEHASFAGTISIGEGALTAMLVELVRSSDRHGGVVLVNGHGGNQTAVAGACNVAAAEGRRCLDWSIGAALNRVAWQPPRPFDAHAGWVETSLMLAIAPETVHLAEAVPGTTRPLAEIWSELRAGGVAAVSRTGVLGDPSDSTPELGEQLLDLLVADLVDRVQQWRAPANVVRSGARS